MDCSPPGSSVHGILQARVLEWVATSSSRGSSPPRDQSQSLAPPAWAGGSLTPAPPGEPVMICIMPDIAPFTVHPLKSYDSFLFLLHLQVEKSRKSGVFLLIFGNIKQGFPEAGRKNGVSAPLTVTLAGRVSGPLSIRQARDTSLPQP